MRAALLLALMALATGGDMAPATLDHCATDTQCVEAAARHCAAGEMALCDAGVL